MQQTHEALKAEVTARKQEDDMGVFGVWWLANSRYPDHALSARPAVAESVVSDPIDEGPDMFVSATRVLIDRYRTA